jgi:hypothetical protein
MKARKDVLDHRKSVLGDQRNVAEAVNTYIEKILES